MVDFLFGKDMELIDKNKVLDEIQRMVQSISKNNVNGELASIYGGQQYVLMKIFRFVDDLEVKKIDLEDKIKENLAQKYIDYTFKRHNIDPKSKEGQLIYYAYMHGMNQCIDKLKAQKGE